MSAGWLGRRGLAQFVGYCRQRLADDPHLWLTTLFDEIVELGYAGSYPALSAAVRRHELRPRCEACAAAKSKDRSVVAHPAGEESQWDWLELPDPPGALALALQGASAVGRVGAFEPGVAGWPSVRTSRI
jgi:hypothetical protein